MPFKSEKQRRFMWAEHPQIAKRWAHEYPESNKGLPMYADKKDSADSKEKQAALGALGSAIAQFSGKDAVLAGNANTPVFSKKSVDILKRVDIPHSEVPTYAGEEREKGEQKLKKTEGNESAQSNCEESDEDSARKLLAKISAVLARPYREELETSQAAAEGREPRFVPQNMGLKRYSISSPYVTPPMGMGAPPPNASATQGAQAAQQNMPQPGNTPVGGGSNPQHNPIQAFGPLGAKGQLNGNAAFGQKNSPDSLKTAEVAWGGKTWAYTPKRGPVGINAGYTYLGGVLPIPHVGVDIGTASKGLRLNSGLDVEQSKLIGLRAHQSPVGFSSHESALPSVWKMLKDRKRSPDSLKTAGITSILGGGEKQPAWYGPEGLVEVNGGGYRLGHTHGLDVRDQKPGWLRRIFDRDPYVLREDVPKIKKRLKAIRGMHVMEQPYKLEFSHMGQLKPEMRQLIEAAISKNASAGTAVLEATKRVLPNMLLQRAGIGAGVGAVGGGAIGAMRAKPGERLRGAATGAGIGAGLGAGTGAASALLAPYLQRQVAQARPNLPPPASGNALTYTPKPKPGPSTGGAAAQGPRPSPKPPTPPPVPPAVPPAGPAPAKPSAVAAPQAAARPASKSFTAAELDQMMAQSGFNPAKTAPRTTASLPQQAAQQAASAKPVRSAAQARAAQAAREEAARTKFFKNIEVAPGVVPQPRQIGEAGSGRFRSFSGGDHIFTEGKVRPTYWDDQVKATGQYFSGVQKGKKIDYPSEYLAALGKADFQHRLQPDKFPQVFKPQQTPEQFFSGLKLAPQQTPEQFFSGLKLARFVRPLPPGVKQANSVLGLLTGMDFHGLPDPSDLDLDDEERSKTAGSTPAWQRSAGKNPEGGLNAKGRASYKRETGGTLKAPVTESNPSGERAKRQNSFCSRMCGMKRVNTGAKTKSDPDSRINKALRKWNCKCGSATDLLTIAHQG